MRLLIAACLAASAMGAAHAQSDFPAQPVTFVVGFAPGGGMDTMARLLGARLSREIGQPVVVENRPGAGGTIAPAHVAAARPDGYTLYAGETSAALGPVFQGDVGYDIVESFAPVARVAVAPQALVASPSLEVETLAEFIDLVREAPGEYFYAAPGVATLHYLAGEMLKEAAGLEMDAVQFQGGSPSVAAVVAGEVPFGIVSISAALSQAEGGNLVILGHTGPDRVEGFEEIDPIATVVEDFEAMPSQFILAPAGTPVEVVERLSTAIGAALADEGLRRQLQDTGLVPAFQPAAELAAELPASAERWMAVAADIRDRP
ncbi:Bug family tripartite tricarboxylate transporter substrate binding protein [Aureimonas populi]|uniref:Bug family tripartite tricarboxylate transporter substrate binding protein n=1 Tax=Aureimonas populi TaxID=1701758 RepID=A0ABW5CK59_9HYPH|nr:tripartite tricarboxylate transporter substrate binding protein [Aureimonas populi]